MDYSQIKEMKQADSKEIEEQKNARVKRMEYIIKKRGRIIAFENNQEKLEKIKEWYPRAYRVLEYFLPNFIQSPDDMPDCVKNTANRLIYTYFNPSDRYFLMFN